MESFLILDDKVIISAIKSDVLDFYMADSGDTDGIIDQLRLTKGTEVAVFIYQMGDNQYKISMRSNGNVNVSEIAIYFGGGGHLRAAGCTMEGTLDYVINKLIPHIESA